MIRGWCRRAVARGPNVPSLLDEWTTQERRRWSRAGVRARRSEGVRFAFHGRMSTAEYQDRASSRAWQREAADRLVAGHERCRSSSSTRAVRGGCRGPPVPRLLVADRAGLAGATVRRSGARCAVAARGAAIAASGAGGDARAGPGAGPVLGWAAAVRVSAGGCRSASEPGARALGTAAAAVGTGPGDRAARAVDVRAAVGRTQYCRHRAGVDRARRAVPVRGRSAAEPAPRWWSVDVADRCRDLEQPAVHGQAGVGQTATGRVTLRRSEPPVDVSGGVDGLGEARASRAGVRD